MMNTIVDNLMTTNLVNIKTLSGATKLLEHFTGKVIIFLPSYVNSKAFVNRNTGLVKKTSHAILCNVFCFIKSF